MLWRTSFDINLKSIVSINVTSWPSSFLSESICSRWSSTVDATICNLASTSLSRFWVACVIRSANFCWRSDTSSLRADIFRSNWLIKTEIWLMKSIVWPRDGRCQRWEGPLLGLHGRQSVARTWLAISCPSVSMRFWSFWRSVLSHMQLLVCLHLDNLFCCSWFL